MTTDYYKLLEVDREASVDVIEAAYRRLALRYHPDRNTSPDATRRMQEINEAYATLRDPVKRQKYNVFLGLVASASRSKQSDYRQSQPPPAYTPWSAQSSRTSSVPVRCESCGTTDTTLRYAVFPYVISLLIVTLRRGWSGLYCEKCRYSEMSKAKMLSFALGWWGFPFGPIFTLGSLFTSGQGKIPEDVNASYLIHLGNEYLKQGDSHSAKSVLKASLAYRYNEELAASYRHIFGEAHNSSNARTAAPTDTNYTEKNSRSNMWGLGFWLGLLALFVLILVFFSTMPVSDMPTSAEPTSMVQLKTSSTAQSTPTAFATQMPTEIPARSGTITGVRVALREGPGVQYLRLQPSLLNGESFHVIGQHDNCRWLQISSIAHDTAWFMMDEDSVDFLFDCSSIPSGIFRPESSILYQSTDDRNLGELRIENGSQFDTVLVLSDTYTPTNIIAAAYIRASQTYTISSIPDGLYSVYTRSGNGWNGKDFSLNGSIKRFDDPFEFTTDAESYSVWTLALTPVRGGNAPSEVIDEDQFPEIPRQ